MENLAQKMIDAREIETLLASSFTNPSVPLAKALQIVVAQLQDDQKSCEEALRR